MEIDFNETIKKFLEITGGVFVAAGSILMIAEIVKNKNPIELLKASYSNPVDFINK